MVERETADPSDRRRMILMAALGLWLLAFGYAFVYFAQTEPIGSGFTRGLNRVSGFMGWHVVAGLVGGLCFWLSRGWPKGHGIRTIGAVPLWLAGAEMSLLVTLLVWSWLTG